MLKATVAAGDAPNFGALLDRGELVADCVSTFPSVTPVASSEMVTGLRPDGHGISAVNWFSRIEQRYVEYGSSFEATRALGLIRTLYDIVYDMNMAHLSAEAETVFERLGDAGISTACTPFLIYRGRRRHEVGLEGVLGESPLRPAFATRFGVPTSSSTASSTRAGASRAGRRSPGPGPETSTPAAWGGSSPRTGSTTSCSSRCRTTTTTRTSSGPRRPSESIALADARARRARRGRGWNRALPRRATP